LALVAVVFGPRTRNALGQGIVSQNTVFRIESFATNLFNTWGIGDREKSNGFMILVAVHDRRVRIELGSGYSGEMDQVMQRVMNEDMLPLLSEEP
jgi:uncharacterized membrane protein YgcG